MLHILIVDDSPEDRLVMRRLLTQIAPGTYTFSEVDRGDHALAACQAALPDCVLLDQHLPDMNGLNVLTALREMSDVPVVLLTGVGNESLAAEAIQRGAQEYLSKDMLFTKHLSLSVQRAIATVQLARERNRTHALLATVFDTIPVGVAVLDQALQILHINTVLAALLGHPVAVVCGQGLSALWPALAESLIPYAAQMLATGHLVGPYELVAISPTSEAQPHTWQISVRLLTLPDTGAQGLCLAVQDVTALRQASAIAAQALARLDATVSSSPSGIGYLDCDLRYQMVNPALAAINGKTPEEHIGRTPADILPVLAHRLEPMMRQVLTTGSPVRDLEIQGPPCSLDGIPHSWLINFFPVPGPTGAVSGMGVTVINLTQIRRTEAALRASEERFRLLAEHAHDVIYRYQIRPNLHLDYLSPAIEQLTGYPREDFYRNPELIGRLMHLADLPTLSSTAIDPADLALIPQPLNLRWQQQDGSIRWTEVNSWVVADEASNSLAVEGIVRDITARKQAKAALEYERQQLNAVVHTMREGVMAFHPDGTIALMNTAARHLSGIDDASLYATATLNILDWPMPVSPLDATGVALPPKALPHHRVLRGEQFANLEVCMRLAGPDSDRWITFNGMPVHDEHGAFILGVMTAQDITQRKHAELVVQAHAEALSQINAELSRALRHKDEFLATMSHELRTPLNGILSFAELLTEQVAGSLNERQLRQVKHIETSGQHLLALINDLLDLAKVESGHLDLTIETHRVTVICEASLLFVREIAIRKQIQVSFVCHNTTSVMDTDARRLKQMLVNLLGNAVKFTPAGGQVRLEVVIHVEREQITFVVADTGIGIAAEDLERLFQPFTQIDNGLTRQHEGTGLGLALVRRLASLMGGNVRIESAGPGQGSVVTLTLPWHSPAAPEQPPTRIEPASDSHERTAEHAVILLAEDNETTISAISEYLSAHGYEVVVARTGEEAIMRAIETQPDLIVMDIQMPVMDGLAATRQLRALPAFATPPIIALTALAMPGDRERSLEAGVNAYLSKPVSLRTLLATIQTMLTSPSVSENP